MLRLELGLILIPVLVLVSIVGGCGSGSSTTQVVPPVLAITKSHTGNFPPGTSEQYSIQVSNTGSSATSGPVTVTDTLPAGLTATGISGTGWTCTLGSLSCSRSDALAAGSNYATITVNVNVGNATGSVTNQATVSGGGAPNATASDSTNIGPGQMKHVVIIFQENRTPDNLFHDPVLISRGADIASSGLDSSGQMIPLTPVSLGTTYDLGHSHVAFLDICDYNSTTNSCAMDSADKVPCGPNCPANPQYQYVQQSDVQPYFTMAETYTFGDRMFQTNEGPSFPAHQYILSGTSAVCVPGNCPSGITSTMFDADNPSNNARADGTSWAGCLAPPGSQINAIDTSQASPLTATTVITELCNEHPTLTDVLDAANFSWKYYAPMPGSIWTAPDAIEHMCVPTSQDGQYDDTVCSGSDWTASDPHVVMEGSNAQIITDISNGQLADVSWVIPDGQNSDHAGSNEIGGPSWVSSIVNAIGASQYWGDTAIIVTWDDWGGWFDHVPPPNIRDAYEVGLRVPLLVISAYAKPAYISHQVNDFGSILKYIEETFSLPEIDPQIGYADSYALGDLSDFFNFSQAPLQFTPIDAPLKADHFLNNKTAPTPPDND